MPKYTATFTCDQEVWKKFKIWAHTINSSASEQLSNYMENCIIKNLSEEKLVDIDAKIEERIEKVVDERLQDLINKRFFYSLQDGKLPAISIQNMGYDDDQIPLEIDLETDRRAEEKEAKNKSQQRIEENPKKVDSSQNSKKHNIYNSNSTDTIDKNKKKTLLKDRGIFPQEKKYYSDQEVGDIENLTRVSINRYRNKKRPPQDKTFFDRWMWDPKQQAWVKLNNKSPK